MPAVMLLLLGSHKEIMPEMPAQKHTHFFPLYVLSMNDAFGITFTGTFLAEVTLPMTQI